MQAATGPSFPRQELASGRGAPPSEIATSVPAGRARVERAAQRAPEAGQDQNRPRQVGRDYVQVQAFGSSSPFLLCLRDQ